MVYADTAMYRVKMPEAGEAAFLAEGLLERLAVKRGGMRLCFFVCPTSCRIGARGAVLLSAAVGNGQITGLHLAGLDLRADRVLGAVAGGRRQRVSVLASASGIWQPHFVECLREVLSESGFRPSRVLLEFTECRTLEPRFASAVCRVHASGVRTAMHDFLNGYSNLTVLNTPSVHEVNIDRKLPQTFGMVSPGAARDLKALRGTVTLFNVFWLLPVAEGAETSEQAELMLC